MKCVLCNFSSGFSGLVRKLAILLLVFTSIIITGSIYGIGHVLAAQHHRVLIFHSYQEALIWDRHINQGIEKVFANSDIDCDLYYEYMDSKRVNTRAYFNKLAELFYLKYNNQSFDLIIASDNNALEFLKEYSKVLFPDTPIIFTGVNGFTDSMISAYDNITGVAESLSIKETIDIALKNHPQVRNIIIYGDQTTTYRINEAQVEELIPEYHDRINFIFRDNLRVSEIVRDLKKVPGESLVLLISTISDDLGRPLSFVRIANIISRANRDIPIYGLWDFFIGEGVVGGKVVDGVSMGEMAAQMSIDYLKGKPISDIKVVKESPNVYMFDYKKLNRFSISTASLPEESIILNKPDNTVNINIRHVLAIIVLFVFLIFITFYLVYTNAKVKRAQREAKSEREFNERIINTAEALMIVMDKDHKLKLINRFAEKLSQYKKEEIIDKDPFEIFFSQGAKEYHKKNMSRLIAKGVSQWQAETTLYNKKGGRHFVSWQNSIIRNQNNEIEGILAIGLDITKQNKIEELLQHQLYHDELTSLPNMKYFRKKLTFSIKEAVTDNSSIAIMMLDLDKFRLINDIYGHQFGDQLLNAVSARLTSILEDNNTVARIGGDDFVILIEDITEVPEVTKIAENILTAIKKPYIIENKKVLIQASIGIAIYPGDGSNEDILIKAADSALYRAKELGNGSYKLYNNDINIRNAERLFIDNNLIHALEEGQLEVYYQPIMNVKTGNIKGTEALLRWNHPEKGFISPGKFIPIAEESGSIIEIGYYVIRQACAQYKKWYQMGFNPGILSVNLSPRQFSQDNLISRIEGILRDCSFPGNKLALEITESTAIINPALTSRILQEMRSKDIGIFLDDFGTGFSSLNYLTRFAVDGLKIDRSFINLLDKRGENQSVVAAIIAMAHELDIKVIAEGVETEEQLQFIKSHNGEFIQGYYCYRPMPAEEFRKLLDIGNV